MVRCVAVTTRLRVAWAIARCEASLQGELNQDPWPLGVGVGLDGAQAVPPPRGKEAGAYVHGMYTRLREHAYMHLGYVGFALGYVGTHVLPT